MANYKTIKKESPTGADILLAKSQIGFNPADTHRRFQISATGLDGGTYTVSYTPINSPSIIAYQKDASEAEAVVSDVDFLYDALIISFQNLGGSASPKIVATFWAKGL